LPALRNQFSVRECLEESYVDAAGLESPGIPDDPELPLLLNQVHPIHEVVKVDYFVPGCPPSADALWTFLNELLEGRAVAYPYNQIHYD
jgi:NAD-reducing hydrogenase small subunit